LLWGERMSQWFPHLGVALNPTGIHVVVPPGQGEDAVAFLERRRSAAEEAGEDRPERNPADRYAAGACWSAMFSLLTFPGLLLTFYCLLRAWSAARRRPPEKPGRYRRLMVLAFLVALLPYIFLLVSLVPANLHGFWAWVAEGSPAGVE